MKLGKIGIINKNANAKIAQLWIDHDIRYCELGEPLAKRNMFGCTLDYLLQNVHRHKRIYYRSHPELLSDFKQVVRGCQHCHEVIEYNRSLTEKIFKELRGKE